MTKGVHELLHIEKFLKFYTMQIKLVNGVNICWNRNLKIMFIVDFEVMLLATFFTVHFRQYGVQWSTWPPCKHFFNFLLLFISITFKSWSIRKDNLITWITYAVLSRPIFYLVKFQRSGEIFRIWHTCTFLN